MQKIDINELRRLWAKVRTITWGIVVPDATQKQEISEALDRTFDALPALLDELEAAREEVLEESNRWVDIIRGIDPEALCDFHDEHGSQDYLKAWLDARDRRMKLIGAAEELERLADSANELREMYLTEEFYGLRAFSPMLLSNSMKQRAAKLRQEAEANG